MLCDVVLGARPLDPLRCHLGCGFEPWSEQPARCPSVVRWVLRARTHQLGPMRRSMSSSCVRYRTPPRKSVCAHEFQVPRDPRVGVTNTYGTANRLHTPNRTHYGAGSDCLDALYVGQVEHDVHSGLENTGDCVPQPHRALYVQVCRRTVDDPCIGRACILEAEGTPAGAGRDGDHLSAHGYLAAPLQWLSSQRAPRFVQGTMSLR
jgi:hypothetical protein